MKQKDYKLEIVNILLKENTHVRGLAKKIGINHMMISRKIKELFKANAIDYRREGKNKVYFLKENPEAKAFIFLTENYKLIQILRKYPFLRKIIENIQNYKKIKLAIIFGSYSKNIAKKDSDIDIYVDTTDRKIKRDLEMTDSKVNIKIGKYNKKNYLIKEIEKNHVIIKGVEKYYEENKFFN
jgi:predicted nucleotidyltransferase|tara:strand:+ start:1524 stop:2072 length:549 start_codon:yes stop_codon:yes gene_type:complete